MRAFREERLQRYLSVASEATSTMVDLSVVFVIETLLLPLVFLWLLMRTLKHVITGRGLQRAVLALRAPSRPATADD